MGYKKTPSIKQQNKKRQLILEKKAQQEYWDRMYSEHPQLKEAMQQFFKEGIKTV